MIIAFFINHLNHHQSPISDELYSRLGDSFFFVETCPPNQQSMKGSNVDYSSRLYLVQAWKDDRSASRAREIALTADVAIFGASSLEYEVFRARNTNALSFEMSERWLKRGLVNVFSPRLLKSLWYYHTLFYRKPFFKLCAGAYCAYDLYRFHSFVGKCFKWGYFIEGGSFSSCREFTNQEGVIRLMWCSRFIDIKHPELAIQLAKRLKTRGIDFKLDMYGTGPCMTSIKKAIVELDLLGTVCLHGALPNDQVIEQMLHHDIFLFTSDRREGWGAVVNEAMSCGCAVVASEKTGSVPYLIKQHETGCVFEDQSISSLEKEVLWLISSRKRLAQIRRQSFDYYNRYWTPSKAADSLLVLINCLMQEREISILEGPCSRAHPIKG